MIASRVGRAGALAALAASCGLFGSCGSSSPTPNTQPLQITCPVGVQADSFTGEPVTVEFARPTISGGAQPVTFACTPASGTPFPMGTTAVRCTATDAGQKTAACQIPVTVTKPKPLSVTRFMAFGDSITEGAMSPCPAGTPAPMSAAWRLRDLRFIQAYVNSPASYPSVLLDRLAVRYPDQSITVVNEGIGGERITDDAWGTNEETLARLRTRLGVHSPQVLLFLEGTNDININVLHPEVSIPAVVKGLHDAAEVAKQRGVIVLLATLPPERAGACRGYAPDNIASANEQIRALASTDGLILVDIYDAFGGSPDPYIGVDGLHPNEQGYAKIADTFLKAIREHLEAPN